MKARVSDQGLVIPKHWLAGMDEVEIRRENNVIVIVPAGPDDPLRKLGEEPLTVDVTDASTRHDHYLDG